MTFRFLPPARPTRSRFLPTWLPLGPGSCICGGMWLGRRAGQRSQRAGRAARLQTVRGDEAAAAGGGRCLFRLHSTHVTCCWFPGDGADDFHGTDVGVDPDQAVRTLTCVHVERSACRPCWPLLALRRRLCRREREGSRRGRAGPCTRACFGLGSRCRPQNVVSTELDPE